MRMHTDRGFTLIELMIVLAIVAVLVALIAPKYQTYVRSANETSATASIAAIAKAEVAYAATCGGGGYAVSMADLAKPPVAGGEGFIDPDLAEAANPENVKDGYFFTLTEKPGSTKVADRTRTCNNAAADPKSGYFATAQPSSPGSTGTKFYAIDERNRARWSNTPLADVDSGNR